MRNWRTRGLGVLAVLMVAGVATAAGGQLASARSEKAAPATPSCNLGNGIKHVIYLQFDNTHLRRDNANVAPAPWVPYTRAGCDFGAVATANTILENTAIDVPTVFGPTSAEAAQVAADHPGSSATQAFADYVGIGIHCAVSSAKCST